MTGKEYYEKCIHLMKDCKKKEGFEDFSFRSAAMAIGSLYYGDKTFNEVIKLINEASNIYLGVEE